MNIVSLLSKFLLIILFCSASNVLAAKIQVSVDRNPVSLDESLQIQFTSNESPDGTPDFSPLEQDFTILNQGQSSKTSWINGQLNKTIQWTVSVMAKNPGTVTIPAISFGRDSSNPLTIEVIAQQNNAVYSNDDLFLNVEATPQNPYLQAQVIYTMRLYRKVDIAQAQLTEPESSDAVITKLDNDNTFMTTIKGVGYSVTERKYAIFPQKSGKLTIKPLVLTAEVLTNAGGFFNSTQTKRVISKEITLDVKPAPASFTDGNWLAAEQLELRQEWSSDFEQMKVGEPITRTLTLQAKGATVSSLPELKSKLDDQLKTYPDQPVLKEQKSNDGILAVREEKIALIPSKAGSYTLPAIKIAWFNTQTNKMEIAKIPETTITVLANGQGSEATKTTTVKPQPTTEPTSSAPATAPTEQSDAVWFWVSVFLAFGWFMTVFYFLTKRQNAPTIPTEQPMDADLKIIINQLKRACADNNPAAAKTALLAWGQITQAATSLGVIANHCDARLRDEILQLNQVLYAKDKPSWSGKKLFQAFIEQNARAKMTMLKQDALEPLHRL